jgi:hypothetical protein
VNAVGFAWNSIRYKEADVSGERSSNSTRYLMGPCFICNRRGHHAANCYKNTHKKNSRRVEDQKSNRVP